MRLTIALALLVALAGCDAAAPSPTLADASAASSDGFLVTTFDANGNSSEHRQDKVAVCHYDDETDTYERISVGAPALSAHLSRHPDGVPGGEVPEADVPSTFGDDCEVMPDVAFTCETVYDVDGLGRPRLTVTTTANDPGTTFGGGSGGAISDGPDRAPQSDFDFVFFSISSNPASVTFGVIALETPNDDLFTQVLVANFPDGSREQYFCGPYPVVPANPS